MTPPDYQERMDRLRLLFPNNSATNVPYRFVALLDEPHRYFDLMPRILAAFSDPEAMTLLHELRDKLPNSLRDHPFASGSVPLRINAHFPTIEERRAWIISNLLEPLGV